MSDPTFVPLSTGDSADDDAQIFDEMLRQNPLPGLPDGAAPVVYRAEKPRKPSRLVSNSLGIPTSGLDSPVQVAWHDLERKSLTVIVSGAATDYVYIADESTKLSVLSASGSRMATRISSAMLPIELNGFTGPLFAMTDGLLSAGVIVEFVSVTE